MRCRPSGLTSCTQSCIMHVMTTTVPPQPEAGLLIRKRREALGLLRLANPATNPNSMRRVA